MNYEMCNICPRNCNVNRMIGEKGVCGEGSLPRVSRAALHKWEEPCITGEYGSGAVFFTGCNLKCVYCQNYKISNEHIGKEISVLRLAEIFEELKKQNASNINLITGTHFLPSIVEAIDLVKANGFELPFVYNTSGYERSESLEALDKKIDIYLPDFKYMNAETASCYSKAADYVTVVKNALDIMVEQVGAPDFFDDGRMKKGVIVRYLLLPGKIKEGKEILNYLANRYQNDIYISLMSQYTPVSALDTERYPELAKPVRKRIYDKLVDYALEIGITQAFIQEGNVAKDSFIPQFDCNGV